MTLVSCICPTYGRAPDYLHLLEEAVESFRRQTYPHRELIVMNDCPEQFLTCDVEGVRVINRQTRVSSLGKKYNEAIELAQGEFICPWEDDDISLPRRIEWAAESIGDADYYNPHRSFFMDGAGLHVDHPQGYNHNCSMFRRTAWQMVGGYPEVSGPQDAHMDGLLRRKCVVAKGSPTDIEKWAYIYRWGVSREHLSSRGGGSNEFYTEVGRVSREPGQYEIVPHWRQDYTQLCACTTSA